MNVYKATSSDITMVAQMAVKMWSDCTLEELEETFKGVIECDDSVIFIVSKEDQTIGFAQCQLRYDYVEGTDNSPVGYLEGIFIEQEYRNCGYAKALLKHCEQWSLDKGCTEFASDCELTNETSLKFHLGVGFQEANRIICFVKRL